MNKAEKVFNCLKTLQISFTVHEHPAVYTVVEAKEFYHRIPGGHCKNLFLRDKKGKNHFLVVAPHDKRINLKELSGITGSANLSFASPERLKKYLDLEPGSVSPFGIINDNSGEVLVIVDEDLFENETLNFHPNINTLTITVSSADFRKFLAESGNEVRLLKV